MLWQRQGCNQITPGQYCISSSLDPLPEDSLIPEVSPSEQYLLILQMLSKCIAHCRIFSLGISFIILTYPHTPLSFSGFTFHSLVSREITQIWTCLSSEPSSTSFISGYLRNPLTASYKDLYFLLLQAGRQKSCMLWLLCHRNQTKVSCGEKINSLTTCLVVCAWVSEQQPPHRVFSNDK